MILCKHRMGVPTMSRSTVVIATAHLFFLMSIIEVHAQDACGCRKIADPRARAACVRGCSSGGTFQPQSTFQLQSTGRSIGGGSSQLAPSVGAGKPGPSVGVPGPGPVPRQGAPVGGSRSRR
jgi:hypothetical protein